MIGSGREAFFRVVSPEEARRVLSADGFLRVPSQVEGSHDLSIGVLEDQLKLRYPELQ